MSDGTLPTFVGLTDKFAAVRAARVLLRKLRTDRKITSGFKSRRMLDLNAVEEDLDAAQDAGDLTAAVTRELTPDQETRLANTLRSLSDLNMSEAAAEGAVEEIFTLIGIVRG